jgi:hypothetical protein
MEKAAAELVATRTSCVIGATVTATVVPRLCESNRVAETPLASFVNTGPADG